MECSLYIASSDLHVTSVLYESRPMGYAIQQYKSDMILFDHALRQHTCFLLMGRFFLEVELQARVLALLLASF